MSLTTEEKLARKRERNRAYAAANYERNRARMTAWAAENYKKNRAKLIARQRAYYHSKTKRQQEIKAGRPKPASCEICAATDQPIEFDHCHKRDVFRGWICRPCNLALGFANDDSDRLRKLIAYLERTKSLTSPQLTLAV